MAKRLKWTFVIGGALGVLAQLVFWFVTVAFTDPTNILGEAHGSVTLVAMGIIGAILGGLGIYRLLSARSQFGAGLPFSGFAFGIGEKMIHGWVKGIDGKNDSIWLCIWRGLWMVIWFNVIVFLATFIVAGIAYYGLGIHDATQTFIPRPGFEIDGPLLIIGAFVFGGLITCFFEWLLIKSKVKFVWILASAWVLGAILTPIGIMPWLSTLGGWGTNVMIMNGGQILYDVAFMFYNGLPLAGHEFAILVGTIGCLFLTGLLCFLVHIFKFGHKSQDGSPAKVMHGDGTPAVDNSAMGTAAVKRTAPPAKPMQQTVFLPHKE